MGVTANDVVAWLYNKGFDLTHKMSLETLLGKDHVDYKTYIENFNIVIGSIDELAFLSNTLDYERLVVFFKEVIETFDFFKNIDENDDNSEGFSNLHNKDNLFLSIIDCGEYKNLNHFMVSYRETIKRKSEKLKEKIIDLIALKTTADENNTSKYIKRDYDGNIKLMKSKMLDIETKLQKNISDDLPIIDEKKVKFDIKLITKNDIICILSSYKFLKKFVYKHMHVIDKEYYTPTKEDFVEFRKELYDIYMMLCEYFNTEKNQYVEDIHGKFLEVLELVDNIEISVETKDNTIMLKDNGANAKDDDVKDNSVNREADVKVKAENKKVEDIKKNEEDETSYENLAKEMDKKDDSKVQSALKENIAKGQEALKENIAKGQEALKENIAKGQSALASASAGAFGAFETLTGQAPVGAAGAFGAFETLTGQAVRGQAVGATRT